MPAIMGMPAQRIKAIYFALLAVVGLLTGWRGAVFAAILWYISSQNNNGNNNAGGNTVGSSRQ